MFGSENQSCGNTNVTETIYISIAVSTSPTLHERFHITLGKRGTDEKSVFYFCSEWTPERIFHVPKTLKNTDVFLQIHRNACDSLMGLKISVKAWIMGSAYYKAVLTIITNYGSSKLGHTYFCSHSAQSVNFHFLHTFISIVRIAVIIILFLIPSAVIVWMFSNKSRSFKSYLKHAEGRLFRQFFFFFLFFFPTFRA